MNSIQTRPGQENSKTHGKKILKIKKPLSGIIFSQNGLRLAEKERKILDLNFVHSRPVEGNSKKKLLNQEIKKILFGIIFSQNGMR